MTMDYELEMEIEFPEKDKAKRSLRRKATVCKAKHRRAISLRNTIYRDTEDKTGLHRYAKGTVNTDKRDESKWFFVGEKNHDAPRHMRKANAMDDRMAEYMEMA